MVDAQTYQRWLYNALFALVCFAVIFIQMLPLKIIPGRIPGPDLLFALTAVWIIRRPNYVPVTFIVIIYLITDILFLRPLGLWTAIMLLMTELLRRKALGPVEISLPFELLLAGGLFVAMIIVNALVQMIFAIPQPTFGAMVLHIITTMMAYPFVIAFSHFILRLKPARPGERDEIII